MVYVFFFTWCRSSSNNFPCIFRKWFIFYHLKNIYSELKSLTTAQNKEEFTIAI